MATTRTRTLSSRGTAHEKAFVVLRVFTGLVWLSNGLAKVTGTGSVDLGFASFSLITRDGARSIAERAAGATQIGPLGSFYRDTVVAGWGFWGTLLTVAELAIGLGLVLGLATRLAALGGLALIAPIWVMLWPTRGYLWEYPAEDLLPLALLAWVPAGRMLGLDSRRRARWPF